MLLTITCFARCVANFTLSLPLVQEVVWWTCMHTCTPLLYQQVTRTTAQTIGVPTAWTLLTGRVTMSTCPIYCITIESVEETFKQRFMVATLVHVSDWHRFLLLLLVCLFLCCGFTKDTLHLACLQTALWGWDLK